jgi:hypothetical protein
MFHPSLRMLLGALMLTAISVFPQISSAQVLVLISEAEAKLPASPDSGMATRGLTRGPGIEMISPALGASNVKSPLPLKIKFVGRNNVAVDPASVKLTYLKFPVVDLTPRIKSYLTKDGIEMPQAEVPPGTHVLRLEMKDTEGRSSSTTITLAVTPK